MTLEECAAHIGARIDMSGRGGVITRAGTGAVYVRFDGDNEDVTTHPRNVRLVPPGERTLFVIITVQRQNTRGIEQATWSGTINTGPAMTRFDVYNWVRNNQLPETFRGNQVWTVFYVAEPNQYPAADPAPAPAMAAAAAAGGGQS